MSSNSVETKQRIRSCLRTYTGLEEERCKELAEEFTQRVSRELQRQQLQAPDVIIKPQSSKKIVLETNLRNCTRSPQEILEDYLERNDRSTDGWRVKQREEKGSKVRITCTKGSRSSPSSSSSKDPTEKAKEAVSKLDEDQKEMLKDLLD